MEMKSNSSLLSLRTVFLLGAILLFFNHSDSVVTGNSNSEHKNDNDAARSRSRSRSILSSYEEDLLKRRLLDRYTVQDEIHGNSHYIPQVTVYSAVITSVINKNAHNHQRDKKHNSHNSHSSHNTNTTEQESTITRAQNIQILRDVLPVPLTEWPAVFTRPCPTFLQGHSTERGVGMSHYQIWSDFVFFDNDVLLAREREKPEYLPGTPYSSISGRFRAYENGTLYKNDVLFSDKDIIMIFEDDVESVIDELNTTLAEELIAMNTDVLFLGWCEGRMAKPVPLCAHAYAITRAGAKKLMKYYEPCGKAVDEQFVMMAKNGWISYRRANPWSYKSFRKDYVMIDRKTDGIFRQNKRIASMNGH